MVEQVDKSPLVSIIMSLVVSGILIFSLFGTWYSQYITTNSTITSSAHRALFGLQVIIVLLGFIVIIWGWVKGSRGGR